jgi:hypothetical protein
MQPRATERNVMNGGVTHQDMDRRKDALEFLKWLERVAPETMKTWRDSYQRERAKVFNEIPHEQ